jgi:hypothetical protein
MPRLSLARFGTSRPALALRLAPFVAVAATAGVTTALRPDFAVIRLGGAIGVLALIGIALPREPLPTISILLLVIDYATATRTSASSSRLATCLVELVALYLVHVCYSVAVGIRFATIIDRSVPRVLLRRLGQTLTIALPVGALAAAVGTHAPRLLWLGVLGVLAALGLAALPFFAFKKR